MYPNFEETHNLGLQDLDLANVMEQNCTELNSLLPGYAQLSSFKILQKKFEKTPKNVSSI